MNVSLFLTFYVKKIKLHGYLVHHHTQLLVYTAAELRLHTVTNKLYENEVTLRGQKPP